MCRMSQKFVRLRLTHNCPSSESIVSYELQRRVASLDGQLCVKKRHASFVPISYANDGF